MKDIHQNKMSKPFFFEGSKEHGVLMLHGFTGTPGTVLPVGMALAEAGLTVQGILLPGHGYTLNDMQQCRWYDWLFAAQAGFDALSRRCKRVSVVGLSMGGTLTLALCESRRVYRAVPIAAALKTVNRKNWAAPLLWRSFPVLYGGRAEVQEDFLEEYNVAYTGTPLRNVSDLNKLMHLVKQNLDKIICPLLVVQAGKDKTVHPDSAKWILNKTSSTHKEYLFLKESPHVCTVGKERALLKQRVVEFLL